MNAIVGYIFRTAILLVVFLFSSLTLADTVSKSPVWKISHEQNTVYIGGTIHALAPSDYPLPTAFNTAYNDADILVLETDIAKMQSPEAQALLSKVMLYSNGMTLQKILSPEVYKELSQFLASRGGDITRVAQFKPGMLSIILTLEELKRLNQLGQGVDDYFDKRAQADNKTRLFFEVI